MQQSTDRGRGDHELQCAAIYNDYNICSNLQIEGEGPQTNLVETGTY
jgi:hypothetical protein